VKEIRLNNVVPEIFANRSDISSDIWLNDVVLERGKNYLIEAASGTGKSSLCSYLYGQRGDYRGVISFDGEDVMKYDINHWCNIRQHNISILFQDLRLFGELTALENVEIKSQITHFSDRATIERRFEELGIADKLNTRIDRLSFGQQQRVALIRALSQPIDFLMLDEPISHLDERNSAIMRDMILEEQRRQGFGIIATSIGRHIDMNYDKVLKL
jgi:ABC-type lipoprotein export system ATPase subunit